MTISRLKREIKELKEAAVKNPDLWIDKSKVKEDVKKELGELRDKIKFYCDSGIFDENDHSVNLDFDINCVDHFSSDLIKRWKNRHNLILDEKNKLFTEIGLFKY